MRIEGPPCRAKKRMKSMSASSEKQRRLEEQQAKKLRKAEALREAEEQSKKSHVYM